MRLLPPLLAAALALVAAAIPALARPMPHQSLRATFPIEIQLRDSQTKVSIDRPAGIVAGFGTTLYVASETGQLFITDVKTGLGTLLNPGGDDQRFSGLCLDSRGPGTLYAPGKDTGLLFAFNRRGELLRKYQITSPQSEKGTAYLAQCIQTRFQLLITDANNPVIYYLELLDEGPLRGHPAVPDPNTTFQGIRMDLRGDWVQTNSGFNAYGVEWSRKFNETAYVMNSATGELFTMAINKTNINPVMQRVEVMGSVKTFPGALQILFDSRNENVMYIALPHRNAIAVIEVSRLFPRRAKFIRYFTSTLIDGPLGIGEFGEWIFPISGHFRNGLPRGASYSIVQLPRHEQIIDSPDPDEEFTTNLDDVKVKPPREVISSSEVEDAITRPPPEKGTKAPVPITPPSTSPPGSAPNSPDESPDPSDGGRPTSTFGSASEAAGEEPEDGPACFPSSATASVEGGAHVRMDELSVGDRVLAGWDDKGEPLYSDVYMFSHQHPSIRTTFISIEGSHKQKLELSPGHYLYINGRLATASKVKQGDVLDVRRGERILALSVRRVRRRGLYNPQTTAGDIVVAGVKVSTYTSAVEPVLATALTAPLRAAFSCHGGVSRWISLLLSRGSGGIAAALPSGRAAYL